MFDLRFALQEKRAQARQNTMIRDYHTTDFGDCLQLVNAVWKFDTHFSPPALADFFLRVYTGSSLADSNVRKVVEEETHLKGFLFGKIADQPLYPDEFNLIGGQARLLFQFLRLRGVSLTRKLSYANAIRIHERNRRNVATREDSEVNLIVVDPKSQRKGFGTKLLNEFIAACRQHNVTRIVLETDQESNYGFYEHLGFAKKGQFYSPLLRAFSGDSGTTFIYELPI